MTSIIKKWHLRNVAAHVLVVLLAAWLLFGVRDCSRVKQDPMPTPAAVREALSQKTPPYVTGYRELGGGVVCTTIVLSNGTTTNLVFKPVQQ